MHPEDEKEVLNIDFIGDREVDERPIFSTLILGENGTVKSTFVKLLLYILGVDIPDFIDEISKFSSYDFDLIDKFAKKYGITVLTAGDFD